ncbi:hypothetical protein JG688_00012975 [Phytophthora aleatoria]|uniref:Uncharacterized protein n=1 Tax=Phytophthora aleatoria TaxID=2496075 RepID=A0A8J5ME63_9STRA|nr:hypothetical protein JG688_00012975 [Phytophthora aleatoria]
MDPRTSPISSYNIVDLFNLPASMGLLDDEDFESTMMMLDNAAFRGEDSDNLELNLTGLSDAFNSQDTGSPRATGEQHSMSEGASGFPGGVNSFLSPDLKIRISGRTPAGGSVYIKQEAGMPGYSPNDALDVPSRTTGARLTVAEHDAKWEVATRAHKVEGFAVLTAVARSVVCLAAQKERSVLAYATCTVESVAASRRAARRRTVATATASRTEAVGGV